MFLLASRSIPAAVRLYSTAVPGVTQPTKKIGAFRGGFLGFFVGLSVAGSVSYYYLLDQYKQTTKELTLEIFTLREALDNVQTHIRAIEEKK